MEALTPASADSLPPLGELIADEPFWRHGAGTGREGVAHLRVWLTAGSAPGHLAVVTEIGYGVAATESTAQIWAELSSRYGLSLVLLEHQIAPEEDEGAETLDLVRIGTDGSPHWLRVWPTLEEHPRHAGLELWMANYGHRVVGKPASWFDWREDGVRRYTADDAAAAAAALREISAGHEEAAAAIVDAAGLAALSNDELEDLCRRFGVET